MPGLAYPWEEEGRAVLRVVVGLCPGVCPPGQAPDLLGLAGSRPPGLGIAQSQSSRGLQGVWRATWLEFHVVGDGGVLSQPPPSVGLSSFGPWHTARLMGGCLLNASFGLTMKPALPPLAGRRREEEGAGDRFVFLLGQSCWGCRESALSLENSIMWPDWWNEPGA